jgi:hypothetical protein
MRVEIPSILLLSRLFSPSRSSALHDLSRPTCLGTVSTFLLRSVTTARAPCGRQSDIVEPCCICFGGRFVISLVDTPLSSGPRLRSRLPNIAARSHILARVCTPRPASATLRCETSCLLRVRETIVWPAVEITRGPYGQKDFLPSWRHDP